jgi:murein DD-endopeptidase MepM/ murein hydrolase activator NlpD
MPARDSRVFGAERPGDRPVECLSGHCGVDLGGEIYGEPVLAAHAGVVNRVQRGPNDDHGGRYVRLSHHDGTVFTQYFHLADITKRIVPGLMVRAGEVVGFLGRSGVKRSGPHLHFTVSVRSGDLERYIDPEPLIALWPVIVRSGARGGVVTAMVAPGMPIGSGHPRPRRLPFRPAGR